MNLALVNSGSKIGPAQSTVRFHSRPTGRYAPTFSYRAQFKSLYRSWLNDTIMESDPSVIVAHPNYCRLTSLVKTQQEVLKLAIEELQSGPSYLVWVLNDAFETKPYDAKDAGNMSKMTAAWLKKLS